jgi:hypothetical protein
MANASAGHAYLAMSRPRKKALERLKSLNQEVKRHLRKIAENPGHSSINHWKREVSNWLRQMKAALPHVGKKTASHWLAIIHSYQDALKES